MVRRDLLVGGAVALAAGYGLSRRSARAAAPSAHFEVEHTPAEWRKRLSPAAFDVLRQQGTEFPNASPLLKEHRRGVFHCAGCDLALFRSETKFESGTGWPSFYAPLRTAVATTTDRSLMMARTEVHCRRCGGHLGHLFDDGPPPTGLRYCMNGAALTFTPA